MAGGVHGRKTSLKEVFAEEGKLEERQAAPLLLLLTK